jgi:hypothetical protein
VRADHAIRVVDPEIARDACPDVAAVGAVALVAQPIHELDPGLGRSGGFPSGVGERARQPEAGQRRRDDVECIGRVAAVGSWVGQRTDQIHELGDRARVPVGDDQRQGVRFGGSDVQEVDPLSVDRGGELGERVEPGLVGSPVVVAAPISGELLQVPERHAPAPVRIAEVGRPACAGEPVSQVVDLRLRNLDPERLDLGSGTVRIRHRGFPLSPRSPSRHDAQVASEVPPSSARRPDAQSELPTRRSIERNSAAS